MLWLLFLWLNFVSAELYSSAWGSPVIVTGVVFRAAVARRGNTLAWLWTPETARANDEHQVEVQLQGLEGKSLEGCWELTCQRFGKSSSVLVRCKATFTPEMLS